MEITVQSLDASGELSLQQAHREDPRPHRNLKAQCAHPLTTLLADAIRADLRLKESLSALLDALEMAKVEGDAELLASDAHRWLRERVSSLRPPAHQAATVAARFGDAKLTFKERQVLELLARGYSNAEIANQLFVSESTVRTHLRSLNAKLRARRRTQAVAIARRLGWVA